MSRKTMAPQKTMTISGPLTPGALVAKPPAASPRPMAFRYYNFGRNGDGRVFGQAFTAEVPDDEYHRRLVARGVVRVVPDGEVD